MAKVIGRLQPQGVTRAERRIRLGNKPLGEIAKQYPNLVDSEEKRKELMNIINNVDVAVDNTGQMRMFYKGEEQK